VAIARKKTTTAKTTTAAAKTETCEYCNRPIGPNSCHPLDYGRGYWCMQRYLIPDESTYILPTPDPIGPAEQKAIDEYEPLVREYEAVVDLALKDYETAKAAWIDAYREAVNAPAAQVVLRRGEYVQPNNAWAEAKRQRLADRAKRARDELDDVEAKVLKQRQELQAREQRLDRARYRGRLEDRGQLFDGRG
jgi:hypothetical protein